MTAPVDWVAFHARMRPATIAAQDLTATAGWTYAALDDGIARLAGALVARGLVPGDRVAVLARNRVELVMMHLACARTRLLYVPLNWRLSPAELAVLVDDAEPALLLGDACLHAAGLQGEDLAGFLTEAAGTAPLVAGPIDPHAPSLILYTSGTSGRPKGVLLSENNIAETAINFSILADIDARSAILCDAPMFHVVGLVTNIRPALMKGGRIVVSSGFSPPDTLSRLGDPALGITHYFCVPQMAAMLRAAPGFDPAALRGVTLSSGGAPHAEVAIRAWLDDGVAMADGFGMSEAGTVLGMPIDRDLIAAKAGSAGLPTPRVATRIVDADGHVLPPGSTGELQLSGANITSGYWRRPEQSAAAFTADGWFRTGDIARIDADGYHWLIDRKKDMFISGGENIYPAEIEAVLANHPGILECAAVGIADARWGEVGHLAIVAHPDVPCDEDEVRASLAHALARYKLPKYITLVPRLPRNGAGKVLKAELKILLGTSTQP